MPSCSCPFRALLSEIEAIRSLDFSKIRDKALSSGLLNDSDVRVVLREKDSNRMKTFFRLFCVKEDFYEKFLDILIEIQEEEDLANRIQRHYGEISSFHDCEDCHPTTLTTNYKELRS